jgi:hypothetical protein
MSFVLLAVCFGSSEKPQSDSATDTQSNNVNTAHQNDMLSDSWNLNFTQIGAV